MDKTGVPSGLVPARCVGCRRIWHVEPPPVPLGHCLSCGSKLRYILSRVPI